MAPDPSELDFSEADVPTDDPSPLRRLVAAQFHEPGGAAVQLFTTATLERGWDAVGTTVAATAQALDLDLDRVELFTSDAYLLQSALGEQALRDGRAEGSAVVACNYHDVPAGNRPAVEERLRRLADLGEVLDLDADVTRADGPRILVGFYDGYREAGLFGAELCDRLGLRALFFPVFETLDEPGTAELTDAELADIAAQHELGFHTASHARADEVDEVNLAREVTDVVARLTALGGRTPRIAAWCGGSRFDGRRLGDRAVRDLGVTHQMSNWAVEAIAPRTAD